MDGQQNAIYITDRLQALLTTRSLPQIVLFRFRNGDAFHAGLTTNAAIGNIRKARRGTSQEEIQAPDGLVNSTANGAA